MLRELLASFTNFLKERPLESFLSGLLVAINFVVATLTILYLNGSIWASAESATNIDRILIVGVGSSLVIIFIVYLIIKKRGSI